MGFGGHALYMIKQMAYNRDLKKANRSKLKSSHNAHSKYSKNHVSLEIKKKEISEAELEHIKSEFKQKLRIQRRQEILISVAVIAILALIILLIIIF